MNVLHVTDNMSVGGLQRVVATLANEFAEEGAGDAGVLAGRGGDSWRLLGSDVIKFAPRPGKAWIILIMLRLVRSGYWQILHVHQRRLALAARLLTLGTSVVVIEHVHNTFRASDWRRILSFRGHELIACGSAVYNMLVSDFHRDSDRISLIENSIPEVPIEFQGVGMPRQRSEKTTICGVGRLVDQKDPLRFARIVAEVRNQGMPIMARWVGDGELRESMDVEIRRLSLGDVLRMIGEVDSVVTHLAASDILLIPSKWEGLPLVALEAMAVGRGIVAADVGSLSDVVARGLNGELFDPDMPDCEVAQILIESFRDGRLERWAENSRRIFVERGSVSAMSAEITELYVRAMRRWCR